MDMMGALIARLLAAGAVAALAADRVYPVSRPQLTGLPAVTLQVIDQERAQHMGGVQNFQQALVQVDAWAASYAAAAALKEAVLAALLPAQSGNGIDFQRAFVRSRDLGEQTDTVFVHRHSMDFTISYSAQ